MWDYKFTVGGGYDGMTDSLEVRFHDAAGRHWSAYPYITIDLAHFGQDMGRKASPEELDHAAAFAQTLVQQLNGNAAPLIPQPRFPSTGKPREARR